MKFDAFLDTLSADARADYELLGPLLEPIAPLLCNPEVSEIFVYEPTRIEYRVSGQDFPWDKGFLGAQLREFMRQIATFNGRKLGFDVEQHENPILEGSLPCGSRVSGSLKTINMEGDHLTIRKHTQSRLTPEDLVDYGSITSEALAWLRKQLIEKGSSILISGGTDSGKTTFLNVLANYLPNKARILVVEDTPELQIAKPRTVRFLTNPRAGVTYLSLLDLCMRQTGDHLVFGEIRASAQASGTVSGSPAFPFTMAINSGHAACLTTIHANGKQDSLRKYVDYCFFSGLPNVPAIVYQKAVAEAFKVVVQLKKFPSERRKVVTSISEVLGVVKGDFQMRDVFHFNGNALKKITS